MPGSVIVKIKKGQTLVYLVRWQRYVSQASDLVICRFLNETKSQYFLSLAAVVKLYPARNWGKKGKIFLRRVMALLFEKQITQITTE